MIRIAEIPNYVPAPFTDYYDYVWFLVKTLNRSNKKATIFGRKNRNVESMESVASDVVKHHSKKAVTTSATNLF